MPDSFSAILDASTGPVAIFTDFDGTLVDIAPTPEAVSVPDALHGRLDNLFAALDGAFAIISGRTVSDIGGFLPASSLSISGSHGAEQRHAGTIRPTNAETAKNAARITDLLQARIGSEAGILIEPKPTGVAVHFRAAPEKEQLVRDAVQAALVGMDSFDAIDGKMVLEIRPHGADKGAALEALLQLEPFANRLPIFIGDDVTDEDGFRAAQANGGFGIKVGDGETSAKFRLPNVASVHEYFDALIAQRSDGVAATPSNVEESIVK